LLCENRVVPNSLALALVSLAREKKLLEAKLMPFAIFGVALAIALLLRHLALRILSSRRYPKADFSAVFVQAVRMPSMLWCFAAALKVALLYAPLSQAEMYWASKGIGAFIIVSASLVAASVLVRMIAVYGERNQMAFAGAGLSQTLINVVVWGIGALILLRHFDISVTPLLTALGVGGLAVALALQDTLANFFAGVHILVEAPIRVGDFIRLSSGEEGVVSDIGWRTTRVHTGSNNTIVIPNTKITSGILTNFSLPEGRVVADIPILVSLDAEPDQVAGIAMEVATNTAGVLEEPSPVVMFDPGVLLTHLQMKLSVHVATQMEKDSVQSRIKVALLHRFREEGVPLPNRPVPPPQLIQPPFIHENRD
jgi:small-conductance mechanosensitive channel